MSGHRFFRPVGQLQRPRLRKNAFDGYLDNSSRWLVNPVNRILEAIPLDPIKSRRSKQKHDVCGTTKRSAE